MSRPTRARELKLFIESDMKGGIEKMARTVLHVAPSDTNKGQKVYPSALNLMLFCTLCLL